MTYKLASDLKLTIKDVERINRQNGGKWFSPGAMRFFDSQVESGLFGPDVDGNYYFVSSETAPKFEGQTGERGPRRFAVRKVTMPLASVQSVGRSQAYPDRESAEEKIEAIIKALEEQFRESIAKSFADDEWKTPDETQPMPYDNRFDASSPDGVHDLSTFDDKSDFNGSDF